MTETGNDGSTIRTLWAAAWRQPDGRWSWVRWGLSLLVPVALLLWATSFLVAPDEPELLRVTVDSQATGQSIEGAAVTVGNIRYLTDANGTIAIDPVPAGTEVRVSAAGHESTRVETGDPGDDMTVSLSAVLVMGSVSDIVSGVPVEGAKLRVLDVDGQEVASARTDQSGAFVFKFIPEDADLAIEHDVYGEIRVSLDDRRSLHLQLDPPPVSGRVVDESGTPSAGATISGPQVDAKTGADGTFALEGVGQGTIINVEGQGSGRAEVIVEGTDLGDIRLTDQPATPVASPATTGGAG